MQRSVNASALQPPEIGSEMPLECGDRALSYVYMLQHATEPIIKIGFSNSPEARSRKLPDPIDYARSSVMIVERSQVNLVEKMFHYVVRNHRVERPNSLDGYSEWFNESARSVILEFVLHNQCLFQSPLAPFPVATIRPRATSEKRPRWSTSDRADISENNQSAYRALQELVEAVKSAGGSIARTMHPDRGHPIIVLISTVDIIPLAAALNKESLEAIWEASPYARFSVSLIHQDFTCYRSEDGSVTAIIHLSSMLSDDDDSVESDNREDLQPIRSLIAGIEYISATAGLDNLLE